MKFTSKTIARTAMVAAVYTAVSLAIAPLAYGTVQIRFAEALTLLPVLMPQAVLGVTIGCAITNAVGFATGANILGAFDIIFGTAATFIAALCTLWLRRVRIKKLPIAAALPPIFINAIVIGFELTFFIAGGFNLVVFGGQFASVFIGQTISCLLLGVPLIRFIENSKGLAHYFE